MLRKTITIVIIAAFLFSSFSFSCLAFSLNEDDTTVDAYLLYNYDNNLVMSEKDIEKKISASSTVKIMTACIALESGISLDTEIYITKAMISDISGRFMSLKSGDVATFEDLLYAMICASFNDATHALALTVSPTLDDFVALMNAKARDLGMESTVYADVTGMNSKDNITTVSDLAKLVDYMSKSEEFMKISSTKSYKFSSKATCEYTTISNRSSLLSQYKGIANFNSGTSGENGQSAVHYYTNSDLSFLCIVMNAKPNGKNDNTNFAEAYTKKLLTHALYDYSMKTVLEADRSVDSLPVELSVSKQNIKLYPKEDVCVYLPKDINIDEELYIHIYVADGGLKAPLKNGDVVGSLLIFHNDKLIKKVDLIVKEDVERNTFLYILELIKSFVTGRFFWILIMFDVLFLLLYLFRNDKRFKNLIKRKRRIRKK